MVIFEKRTWVHLVLTWKGSVVPAIWSRVAVAFGVAVFATGAHLRWDLLHTNLTPLPFTLVGLALSIFLGFRNNTSYDRFWEGRKLWGRLVNVSRTLARRHLTVVRSADPAQQPAIAAWQRAQIYRQIAYVHALRQHLRGQRDDAELAPLLDPAELAALDGEHNRPYAIAHAIGRAQVQALAQGWVDPMHLPLLDGDVADLLDIQGGCERIRATPIPFAYTVLMHRIVAVYCLALPFGIVGQVEHYTPVVVGLISYAFFGLDAVGEEIEDPFGMDPNDLPLASLSRMIEVNLRQRLGETDLPPLATPVDGVLS